VKEGWINLGYVKLNTTKAPIVTGSQMNTVTTTTSKVIYTGIVSSGINLNVRLGPGVNYDMVHSLTNGTEVKVYDKQVVNGHYWGKLGENAWICLSYVTETTNNAGENGSITDGNTNTSTSGGYALVNNPGANERLNLRAAASKSSKSLGKYGNGTYVTVLAKGNTWCKVIVDGKTGYMMTQYLRFYGMSSASTAMVTHPDRTFVYLRGGPSQQTGQILKKVPHGATVTILTPGATWSQVKYNGQTGYMMTKFLKK
jgi:uncharacterized protein YgiM (DUF1202 family)